MDPQYFRSKMTDPLTLSALFVLSLYEPTSMLWTWFRSFVKNVLDGNIIKRFCLFSGTSSPQLRDLGTAFEACRRKDISVTSINLFRNFLRLSRSFCSFHIISVHFASFQHFLHHFSTFCTISVTFAPFLHLSFCVISAPFYSFICTFRVLSSPFYAIFQNLLRQILLLVCFSPNGLFPVPF